MLRIGTRLGISYGVLGALCVGTGVVSYQQTQTVRQKMEDVVNVREPVNSAVHALQHILMESAFSTLGYLSTGDSVLLAGFRSNVAQLALARESVRFTEPAPGRPGIGEKLDSALAEAVVGAQGLIELVDTQNQTLQRLLHDLDGVDNLLTGRIQASVTSKDPIAYRRLQTVLEMKANVNAITKGVGTFLATGEVHFETRFWNARGEFERYRQVYNAVLLSSEEKRWAAELAQRSAGSLALAERVLAQEKERRTKLSSFLASCRTLNALLDQRIAQRTEHSLAAAQTDLLQAGDRAKASILVALVVSLSFGLGAGYLTTRNITDPLRQLSSVMLAIARGDRVEQVRRGSTDEIRALSDAFDLMTGKLLRANAELREAQRERLDALRQFARSVQRAQEDERARISRELHDDLCQRLTGMKFRTEVLEEEIVPAHKRAGHTLRDLTQELDKTIVEVRRISSNLRPSALDDFGLETALRMLCKDFETLHGLQTRFDHQPGPLSRVDPSLEIAVYRICQEALANIAAHAGPSTVSVLLEVNESHLRLMVADTGTGFDRSAAAVPRAAGRGFGLISMRERTELFGGTFQIDSAPGHGTTVTATLPLGEIFQNEKDQDHHRG